MVVLTFIIHTAEGQILILVLFVHKGVVLVVAFALGLVVGFILFHLAPGWLLVLFGSVDFFDILYIDGFHFLFQIDLGF